jgi:uncharacterized protein YutE (UPF0331/DUF86 family)
MTRSKVNGSVIVEKTAWIRRMLADLRDLGLEDREGFLADKHKQAAAESYLRRALEALFDIGRHILARKFGAMAAEYKDIARLLFENRALTQKEAVLLRLMAGYRNRLVHFYHEVGPAELFEICAKDSTDIQKILNRMIKKAMEEPRTGRKRRRSAKALE